MDLNELRRKQDALVIKSRTIELQYQRLRATAPSTTPVRHKCFITYHSDDIDAVTKFVEDFSDVFIPTVIGVSESDHFADPIDSQKEEYIKDQIRTKYLTGTTVTIIYLGRCTWARKYIDWEISSSLRNNPNDKRNGLLGITPPDRTQHRLPSRFSDNVVNGDSAKSYAEYYYYPTTKEGLRNMIEAAFQARTSKADKVVNSRKLMQNNLAC